MGYSEFLAELNRAGLSVRAFAELIGMKPNSISNYARLAEVPVHLALIAVLVAEMSAQGLDFRGTIARVELTPKRPRGRAQPGHFGGDPQVPLDLGS
ncbi:XRE family transcriptional regulator (plasmid) [Agrobacterium fabrum]|uniref:XRE family transcriptional regulator n=1 Tax=Agrobacterium fabrum TaxID=1176649 RepID=UPI000DE56FC1|nr:XRE family transcriptional regulator [Agrobacterium fabrum]NTB10549.1 XRE family transcriptional regulator [Agrobacterium fabrum]